MRSLFGVISLCLVCSFFVSIGVVFATDGMNMIGYEAVSAGMAGAEAAVDTGVMSLSSNPANLSSVETGEIVVNLSVLAPVLNFKNETMFGSNDVDSNDQYFPLPFIGYAQRVGQSQFVWGAGVFFQGGMGVDFENVKTNFGTEDSVFSNVAYGKLVPALSYEITDSIALGLAFQLGYSTMTYKFFPDTSYYHPGPDNTPQTADDMVFPGQKLENAASFGYSARLGIKWDITETTAFGLSYTSEVDLDYEDGDLDMNFSSLGLEKVRYDAHVDGFTWPTTIDFGFSQRLLDQRLLLAADITWYNWSDAMETITVKGDNPSNNYAPSTVEIPFVFNWDDQWAFSIGAEYTLGTNNTIRAGFNTAENPIPDDYMYPLFPAIVENHAVIGYGHQFGNAALDLAWEHAFEKTAGNPNPNQMENPFGSDSEVSHSQNSLHMMITYKL